ncbi:hypothetical protein ACFLX3_00425 [Chloroflexota bacterium]
MSLSIISILLSDSFVVWFIITIAALIIFKRHGGRAERLMLTGASLKLLSRLLLIPALLAFNHFAVEGEDIALGMNLGIAFDLIQGLIGMSGLICIIYGFWVKFQGKAEETVKPLEASQAKLPG